jgi:hypothetical protein
MVGQRRRDEQHTPEAPQRPPTHFLQHDVGRAASLAPVMITTNRNSRSAWRDPTGHHAGMSSATPITAMQLGTGATPAKPRGVCHGQPILTDVA